MDDVGELASGRREGLGDPSEEPVFARIGEMRVLSGLSTETVAEVLGVPHGRVCGWLAGTPAEAADLRRIDAALVALRRVDRGTARENAALLASGIGMLRDGRLAEFGGTAGEGCGRSAPLRVDRARTPLRGDLSEGWLEAVVREGSADVAGAGSLAKGRETRRVPFPRGRRQG